MRDSALLNLRPEIDLEINGEKNQIEHFMHQTLRPILKFQHEIIVHSIENSSHFSNLNLASTKLEERREKLKNYIGKNASLKNQLIGITIALFTQDEIMQYTENTSELNKRIIDMCVTRYDSQS